MLQACCVVVISDFRPVPTVIIEIDGIKNVEHAEKSVLYYIKSLSINIEWEGRRSRITIAHIEPDILMI